MVDRVAALSDIHGVLPALEAVLAEPDVATADLIVLTGDIAAGPQPVATLDRLAALGDRVRWVSGNADRELVQLAATCSRRYPACRGSRSAGSAQRCSATRHRETTKRWCRSTARTNAGTRCSIRLRTSTTLTPRSPQSCAGIHMPFVRVVNRRLVVNPGSVGMPYGTTGAHWALLGGPSGPSVQLRRTLFDAEAACRSIVEASGYSDIERWVDFFVRHPAPDAEAHQVFAAKDGRG